ncbi:MAG TPA: efflux RND transporter periplasmic adaptor subunit [Cytophagaceae bacterium]|jgi:membrane fusion protein (multidrug efflux system)|nr:efflux RND transporter periplasmic adaptor subunit [Cytophagaceae bacterium]
MKKINLLLLLATVVAYACSAPDKKAELADLKKQRDDLMAQISKLEKEMPKDTANKENTQKKAIVITSDLVPQLFAHYVEIQGKVDSDQNVRVSPKSGGVVQDVFVERGQTVSKGALLAQIDASTTIAGINEVKKSLELSKEIFAKQQRLWDEKIGTEVQYLQAKNQKESLEKKLASLNEQYELSRIRAPFTGLVDEIYVRVGEATAPGAPAFRIINNGSLKAVAEVPESYISSIQKGNLVKLYFPDAKKEINSKVQTAADVIDPVNRTFKIEMPLTGEAKSLKANMIAYVSIKDYQKENAIVIPINIVQRTAKGDFVYVVENNKAIMTPVELGLTYKSQVEVLSGLKPGTKIITVGYQDVVDGQPVVLKTQL